MTEIKGELKDRKLYLQLSGHIDSTNAAQIEEKIQELAGNARVSVLIDAQDLDYMSSAGLRILLRLRKRNEDIRIINVKPEVYEVFEMTGFTQMMTVDKAYRKVSVEGCEVIGEGANGKIYRIDQDNVVKVYKNADALDEIQNEREVARLALILGIPTAISYDVVRVGDSYGSVFELLNAKSFSKILATQPERMDWCVDEYVKMLNKIHSTIVPEGDLPDMKETALNWGRFLEDYLPEEAYRKLISLIEAVPHDDHMIHGDYHTKNLELTNDEVILIDMDTLAVGHPVFELASMFNAFQGFSEYDHAAIKDFMGFDHDTATEFWHKVLVKYLRNIDEDVIKDAEDKARIIGYTRLIRRSIRRQGLETEDGRAEIELWKKELLELLEKKDSLLFDRHEMYVEANLGNLPDVLDFAEYRLNEMDCPKKTEMQISIAIEELFTNVAKYAYDPGTGNVSIRIEEDKENGSAVITFEDKGMPYDPLAKEDPDVSLSAEERAIGGLGIFMVKQSMDDMAYRHEDGKNILTLWKKL